MDEPVNRLIGWAINEPQGPISIEIHPTNRCNLNCIMCGTRIEYRKRKKIKPSFDQHQERWCEISDERLLDLVDESAKLGVRKWLISGGGEPFIRKKIIIELMEKIKSKKMFGNINTNGVLLTESDINKIIKMKWDMIMFSIDGHNAEIHDFIRQTPGTFDQVLKNMLLLNESKTNKYEPKVIFNTVIHSKNFNHLDKILELGEQVGTSDITFIPLAVLGPMQDRLELSNDEKQVLQQLLPKYIQLAKKLGIDTNLESLQEGTPNSSPKTAEKLASKSKKKESPGFANTACFEPFLHLVIKMNYSISPCCMLDSEESLKKNSLKSIWFGDYFTNLRTKLIEGKLPVRCKNCLHTQVVHNQDLRDALNKEI